MNAQKHERGFTLVEVLISIGLIGVMLLSFQAVFLGTPLAALTKNKEVALTIAKHKLAELRSSGYDALTSGSFSDPLMTQLVSATGTVAVSSYASTVRQVVVSVAWQERGDDQSVSLTTLVGQVGGLP